MKNIAVKQDEKDPVPVEVLATSICAIAAVIKNLRRSLLEEKALLILISENCKKKKSRHAYPTKAYVSIQTVKSVLDSIESLQTAYLK